MGMWWKFTGVALVLYSLIAGLTIPLGPGILKIDPTSAKAGDTITLQILGYNTHFKSAKTDAWLRSDQNQVLPALSTKALSENTLEITFSLPSTPSAQQDVQVATLLLSNSQDGGSVQPSALFINPGVNPNNQSQWGTTHPNIHQRSGNVFPFRSLLYETIRNTYYHVAIMLSMVLLLLISTIFSALYLVKNKLVYDWWSKSFATTGFIFGIAGILTGMFWAKATWGTYWTWEEIKLNMTAIAMLIYGAYFILRGSVEDEEKRARLSAIYNLFAYAAFIPLIFVIPRMANASLHPGNGGNPAMGGEDLDNTMRMIFYPAIIGWTLIGYWISQVLTRLSKIQFWLDENQSAS
jgi:heme exporter protein C